MNCKVSGKGWNQTESSALIGLRIATPPESSVGPPPVVCIYEIFHGQGSSVVKEVQFTLWGIPEDCRADEFAKFMSVDFTVTP